MQVQVYLVYLGKPSVSLGFGYLGFLKWMFRFMYYFDVTTVRYYYGGFGHLTSLILLLLPAQRASIDQAIQVHVQSGHICS